MISFYFQNANKAQVIDKKEVILYEFVADRVPVDRYKIIYIFRNMKVIGQNVVTQTKKNFIATNWLY